MYSPDQDTGKIKDRIEYLRFGARLTGETLDDETIVRSVTNGPPFYSRGAIESVLGQIRREARHSIADIE